jgi:hypothetical protein
MQAAYPGRNFVGACLPWQLGSAAPHPSERTSQTLPSIIYLHHGMRMRGQPIWVGGSLTRIPCCQPPSPSSSPPGGGPSHHEPSPWPSPQEEARRYNDTLVVRGPDTYRNLPNKTVRLMRYAAAHPAGFTHVLKTDDDCYVRLPHLLKVTDGRALGT